MARGGLQDRPVCFDCRTGVDASDAVFAAPCDHEECPSLVWHGLCLMRWRERRDQAAAAFRRWLDDHAGGAR